MRSLQKKLDTIQICLIGKGQYVIPKKAAGKVEKISQYNANLVSFKETSPKPPIPLKPTNSSAPDRLEGTALLNKDNSDYFYQASDVKYIVQSPTISAELRNVRFISGLQTTHLAQLYNEILVHVNQGLPVLCVFNIDNAHWATFCLVKDVKGQLVTLYKDSLGGENSELFRFLQSKSAVFKSHPTAEQRGDGTSCGIFALENMRIMAQELNRDRERFIREFQTQPFCTLETARILRQVDYPRFYAEGLQEFERQAALLAEKAKQLAVQYQAEADQIVARLQANVPAGIQVQSQDIIAGATRTIVVQIGAENSNLTRYHYRIVATKDIGKSELQDILSQSEYAWYEPEDYRIEDGIFKVFKKN